MPSGLPEQPTALAPNVASDRDQIIVFVAAAAGVGQGIVEACAGHIDYVEAMLASGSAQQINDMTAHLGALAFVRCRIADHGNGRIRM